MSCCAKKNLIEELFVNFIKAQVNLMSINRALIEQQGISFPCWKILSLIRIYDDLQVTMPLLADMLVISRQAIQRQIKFLIQDHYIKPHKNPGNKKSAYYKLTEKGENKCADIITHVYDPWIEKNFKDFDEASLRNALEIFIRLKKL